MRSRPSLGDALALALIAAYRCGNVDDQTRARARWLAQQRARALCGGEGGPSMVIDAWRRLDDGKLFIDRPSAPAEAVKVRLLDGYHLGAVRRLCVPIVFPPEEHTMGWTLQTAYTQGKAVVVGEE